MGNLEGNSYGIQGFFGDGKNVLKLIVGMDGS